MANINVFYEDEENGIQFELNKTINSEHIADNLNAMVDILRLMGFSDMLIEKWIGSTYFTVGCAPFCDDDDCNDCRCCN